MIKTELRRRDAGIIQHCFLPIAPNCYAVCMLPEELPLRSNWSAVHAGCLITVSLTALTGPLYC